MQDEERDAWLRLKLTPGVGDATARKLLAAFGLPPGLFTLPQSALSAVAGPALATRLLAEPEGWRELCARTSAWLAEGEGRRHLITLGDPNYPAELLQTEDPPLLLHVEGDLAVLRQPLRLAMVGSRNPTAQGADNARAFAQTLAAAGACIISGLALGIDAAAHQGALEAGGSTLAIVGTGLDLVYPKQHQALARRIAAQGALVSEYLLGTPPLAPNFPRRNRIISGLSQGVLVVEAALQSGSLITARQAAEQGREVFAIPGSIHSPQSRGCHALIRQGAKLVESAQDILEELQVCAPAAQAALATAADQGAQTEPSMSRSTALLRQLGYEPCGLDTLQARSGLDTATLQAWLLELEFDGLVARLPGGLYQRRAAG